MNSIYSLDNEDIYDIKLLNLEINRKKKPLVVPSVAACVVVSREDAAVEEAAVAILVLGCGAADETTASTVVFSPEGPAM